MRNFPAGLAAILVPLAFARMAHAAEVVAPSSMPITQAVVTLSAGVDTTLVPSRSRKYICLMNIGTGLVTLGFDQAAVAGSGWALDGASTAGHQGGSMCWESATVAGSELHAISTAGSTMVILESR